MTRKTRVFACSHVREAARRSRVDVTNHSSPGHQAAIGALSATRFAPKFTI